MNREKITFLPSLETHGEESWPGWFVICFRSLPSGFDAIDVGIAGALGGKEDPPARRGVGVGVELGDVPPPHPIPIRANKPRKLKLAVCRRIVYRSSEITCGKSTNLAYGQRMERFVLQFVCELARHSTGKNRGYEGGNGRLPDSKVRAPSLFLHDSLSSPTEPTPARSFPSCSGPRSSRRIGRRRLRHLLGTLRAPLEAGLQAGSVLIADRVSIRVNPQAVTTDVQEFERAIKSRDFETARKLYTGELLPGLYDDWILEERYRLEALAEGMPPSPEVPRSASPRSSASLSPPTQRVPAHEGGGDVTPAVPHRLLRARNRARGSGRAAESGEAGHSHGTRRNRKDAPLRRGFSEVPRRASRMQRSSRWESASSPRRFPDEFATFSDCPP